ncbi:MAG: cob(I)yrinic acid a,c-diamide adenosyltransferase [Candidatus Aenigmarchaeota archaeon]|nr:cob(I)yrinic acid a,c-diamide adenosyltransferase [Candidatus Aenigmarchaeota archaeon]
MEEKFWTGDQGTTRLCNGSEIGKDHARVEAYGAVDELNSYLGIVKTKAADKQISTLLHAVQHDLFVMGSDLATPLMFTKEIQRITKQDIKKLEQMIAQFESQLPPIAHFVVSGGMELAAHLHYARSLARNVERRVIVLHRVEEINKEILFYLNRLSYLFFVLSRVANVHAGTSEELWTQSV